MAYRDDLDAARMRAETLAREVETLTVERDAGDEELEALRDRLGRAERELVRLRGAAIETPQPRETFSRPLLGVGIGLAIATAVAGSQSETAGIAMSYVASVPLGIGLGGRIRGTLGAVVGGIALPLLLALFYASIWSSL